MTKLKLPSPESGRRLSIAEMLAKPRKPEKRITIRDKRKSAFGFEKLTVGGPAIILKNEYEYRVAVIESRTWSHDNGGGLKRKWDKALGLGYIWRVRDGK